MEQITYYHVLGVSIDATDDEIIVAFRTKVKQWHPDICCHPDAEERMREINRAAEVLCDPERRRRYDLALAGKAPFEKEPKKKKSPFYGHNRGRDGRLTAVAWMGSPLRSWSKPETFRFAGAGLAAFFFLVIIAWALVLLFPVSSLFLLPDRAATSPEGNKITESSPVFPDAAQQADGGVRSSGNSSVCGSAWAFQVLGFIPGPETPGSALSSPDNSFSLAQKGSALIDPDIDTKSETPNRTADFTWMQDDPDHILESLDQTNKARGVYDISGLVAKSSGSSLFQQVIRSGSVVTF